jgi:hypothetical protein
MLDIINANVAGSIVYKPSSCLGISAQYPLQDVPADYARDSGIWNIECYRVAELVVSFPCRSTLR